jgi:hypothetical protein
MVPLNVHECGSIVIFILLWRWEAGDYYGRVNDTFCYNSRWDMLLLLFLSLPLSPPPSPPFTVWMSKFNPLRPHCKKYVFHYISLNHYTYVPWNDQKHRNKKWTHNFRKRVFKLRDAKSIVLKNQQLKVC